MIRFSLDRARRQESNPRLLWTKTMVDMENVGALSPVDGEAEYRMREARRTGWSESCRGSLFEAGGGCWHTQIESSQKEELVEWLDEEDCDGEEL